MAYTRVHRLLRILLLVQSSNGWNARRLALECGVTERTIYRDLEELEAAGVPWHYDPATDGYRVRKDFFLPPLHLTADEAAALHAYVAYSSSDVAAHRSAVSALRKVVSQLPESVRTALGGDAEARAADGDGVEVELLVDSPHGLDGLPCAPWTHALRVERVDADNGATVVRCRTHDEDALSRWVLAQGGACVVLQPPSLAARVLAMARGVAESHNESAAGKNAYTR